MRNTFILLFSYALFSHAQKECSYWMMANQAGLDFNTIQPTPFLGSNTFSNGGCASVADSAGNLLFYANSSNVWNKQHLVMANGSGLSGNYGGYPLVFVVKQPGNSNCYYLFQYTYFNSPVGLLYSVVDMNLAAGLGSVTAKSVTLATPPTHRFGAVRHANGIDIWILTHDFGSSNFNAYLLTAAGFNTVATVSSSGFSYTTVDPGFIISASPNGRKLAANVFVTGNNPYSSIELYDFNRSTGVVSNAVNLGYPCERNDFSPDGTKLYSCNTGAIVQWDLCAGAIPAIIASLDTVGLPFAGSSGLQFFQAAPNGKIYGARNGLKYLSVINSPNTKGVQCNYKDSGQTLGGRAGVMVPKFYGYSFAKSPGIFTYKKDSTQCAAASFTAPCLAAGGYTGVTWLFGDPQSGAANSNTLSSSQHTFSFPGTYKVKLVLQGAGFADTLEQTLSFGSPAPSVTVTGRQTICKGENTTVSANGANSYSWSSGAQTPSISLSPSVTVAYTVTGSYTNTACKSQKIVTLTVQGCTGFEGEILSEIQIKVFPNPAGDELFYSINEVAKHCFAVCDISGRVLAKGQGLSSIGKIDLITYSAGMYILTISVGDKTKSSKFVVR